MPRLSPCLASESSLFIEKFQILSVALLFEIFFGNESQGSRIHAIPEPCRCRTVVKHMAEMGIGMFAPDLGAFHKKTSVFLFNDIPGFKGFRKTWPSGPRLKLIDGTEQGLARN